VVASQATSPKRHVTVAAILRQHREQKRCVPEETMQISTRRRFLRNAGAALAAPALPRLARAQEWPTRPIKAMVPFAAGSSIDVIARMVFEPLSQRLGQPIIVENRGGAGGVIGTTVAANADPDGYTILAQASAHSAAPAAYPKISYDPARDFSAVASFGIVPNLLVTGPTKNIKTVDELVARAKQQSLNYASAGVGSASHWAAERFRVAAGIQAVHVPFRGGPDATLQTMMGNIDFYSPAMTNARANVADGRLVALAVSTLKRSSAMPEVPTLLELGYKDADYTYWNGLFVPAKTPREIVAKLYREITAVLELPAVKEKFNSQGIEPMPMTPEEFDALIVKEIAANHAIVKAAGLKFN
jgi:tripartite-type tricarboxylate transporter receptor subunit TctC